MIRRHFKPNSMARLVEIAIVHLIVATVCNAYTNHSKSESNETFDVGFCESSLPEELSALHRNECCSYYHTNFRRKWSQGGHYLTSHLVTLKKFRCVQFETECLRPLYDFTPFTKLVYSRFCNRRYLIEQCIGELREVSSQYKFSDQSSSFTNRNNTMKILEDAWKNLIVALHPAAMTLDTLNIPCVQVALFDRPAGGVGRFHEITQPYTIFCPFVWVGYDIDTAMERNVSPWTSWSIRCKSSLVISMIVTGILAVAVISSNVIVLSVYLTTPKLRNSQAIYKISVAVSDLLSGLIVIPNSIVFAYQIFFIPRKMGGITSSDANTIRRLPGGSVQTVATTSHIYALGFFTTLTLAVSLYTLLAASFDRFWAIFRPLTYIKAKSKKYARNFCIASWIIAIFISTLPYMVSTLKYKLTAGLLVTSVGDTASLLMMVALAIPLLLVCITNILIFRSAKKHARVRQKLKISTRKPDSANDDMEKRLSKILGLMVGVFTACVLPVVFTTMISAAIDNIVFAIPERLDVNAVVIYNSSGYCFILILLSNSLWNCLIYSARGTDFRKAVKSLRLFKIAGSTFETALSSMRRLSKATTVYYRRKSSAATDINSSSSVVQTTRVLMNTGNSDSSRNDLADIATNRSQNATARGQSESDAAGSLSTFDSFAINAGADRLYLSVMDNIEET